MCVILNIGQVCKNPLVKINTPIIRYKVINVEIGCKIQDIEFNCKSDIAVVD